MKYTKATATATATADGVVECGVGGDYIINYNPTLPTFKENL